MKRSKLESKYAKNKTSENLKFYKKQRNFCSKLYKKERKKYERLDLNNVTDSKEFWITVKPFLSDNVITFPKMPLVENGVIISDELKLPIHLVISLKILCLVSKQTNIQMRTTV